MECKGRLLFPMSGSGREGKPFITSYELPAASFQLKAKSFQWPEWLVDRFHKHRYVEVVGGTCDVCGAQDDGFAGREDRGTRDDGLADDGFVYA